MRAETGDTKQEEMAGLTELGRGGTQPSAHLESFPNRNRDRDYLVVLSTDEFTCLCPATGQPDFARICIRYVPDARIVESKSLKLYFWSFRSRGVFHEHVINLILDDLVKAVSPRWMEVTGDFGRRGGIAITVRASMGLKPPHIGA